MASFNDSTICLKYKRSEILIYYFEKLLPLLIITLGLAFFNAPARGQVNEKTPDTQVPSEVKSGSKENAEAIEDTVQGSKIELHELKNTGANVAVSFDFGGIGGGTEQAMESEVIAKSSDEVAKDASQRPIGFGDFGDQIDTYTGAISFSHTDVTIPGNSHLEVAIHRTLSQATKYHPQQSRGFGDWELEVPKIYRKVAQVVRYDSSGFTNVERDGIIITQFGRDTPVWMNQRCSRRDYTAGYYQLPNRWATASGGMTYTPNWSSPMIVPEWFYDENTYSDGTHISIPGQASQEILDTPSGSIWNGSPKKVTKNHWKFECISSIPGGGEGFIAIAPNGDRWKFDKLVFKQAPYIRIFPKGKHGASSIYSITGASYAMLLATEVKDVNGNWVRYSYNSANNLNQITSNDGRKITLEYHTSGSGKGEVKHVKAHGQTWSYLYNEATAVRPSILKKVTLPDNRKWEFDLDRIYFEAMTGKACNLPDFEISLKHPDGALAKFTLAETIRIPSTKLNSISFNARCSYDPTTTNWAYTSGWSRVYETVSIVEKTISGSSMPTSTWQYSYNDEFVTVIDPVNNRTEYEFYKSGAGEGKAKHIEKFDSSGLLSVQYDKYIKGPVMGRTFRYGSHMEGSGDTQLELMTESTVTLGQDSYTTLYTYNTNLTSTAYSFGKPTRIQTFSNLQSTKRIEDIVYTHNKGKWVIGLPFIVKKNNKEFERYGYDALGRNTWINRFGSRKVTKTYYSNGTVASSKDGENNSTNYSSYKRGKPQIITRADHTVLRRTYNDNGWLTSATDPRGTRFDYGYDSMGRLKEFVPPYPWEKTLINYSNLGLGLVSTVTYGDKATTTTHDQLLRPILVKTQALAGGGKTSYVKTSYDELGRTVFNSLPSTVSNPSSGQETVYDGLNRITLKKDTMAPFSKVSHLYSNNNAIETTDANGHKTVSYRSGYGSPEDGSVTEIESPLGVTTSLSYDIYGNVLRVRQRGNQNNIWVDFKQEYFYDSELRLCRHRTPESGDAVYSYYKNGLIKSSATGMSVGSGCGTPSGITFKTTTYDKLNRPYIVDYADPSTPDIIYSYDDNDNLLSLQRDGADWSYEYDNMNNLLWESLTVDNNVWTTKYTYSDTMYLRTLEFPSGRRIDYSLNGLGQVSGLKSNGATLASNFTYHVNGLLAAMRYANGHYVNQSLNSRLQPQRLWTSHSSKPKVIDLTYTYDKNSNTTAISDGVNSTNSRSFSYDALNRLSTATGPFGNSSFKYDAVGNLRQKRLGSRTIDIFYDSNNRVSSAKSAGAGVATATSSAFNNRYYYDSRGNVVDSGKLELTYNAEDQPLKMLHGSGYSAFRYDAHKRRVKEVFKTSNGTKTSYSIYSKSGILVYKENVTDQHSVEYLPLGLSTTGSIRIENDVPSYIHLDALGSPIAETNASGNIVWNERYTPYGEKLDNPSENKNDQGFTGHVSDDSTGLVYMQARYYDPVIGRFYSNDPVGFDNVHNFNRYSYANNNPYKYVDPDGRDAVAIVFPDYKISVAGTKVSNLGHAGLLNINPDTGLTRYYEFGRYGNDGMVRNIRLDNDVVMSGGAPTSASLAKVFAEISSKSGQGGAISAAYFSGADFASVEAFANPLVGLSGSDGGYGDWSMYNSCGTFMQDGLEAGGVNTPMMIDPRPNSYIGELQGANGAKSMSYSVGVFRVSGRIESRKLDEASN